MAQARAASQDRLHRLQLAEFHHTERRLLRHRRKLTYLPSERVAGSGGLLVVPTLVRALVASPAVVGKQRVPGVQHAARLLVHHGAQRARRTDVRSTTLVRIRRRQSAAAGGAGLSHDSGALAPDGGARARRQVGVPRARARGQVSSVRPARGAAAVRRAARGLRQVRDGAARQAL